MSRAPDETKPMKVQLPLHQHVKLHSLRVLTDRSISDMVEIAVGNYVDLLREEGDAAVEEIPGDGPAG